MSTARPEPGRGPAPAWHTRARRRPRLVAAASVLLLALALVACGSDYRYMAHDASGLYFRVPDSWTALSLPEAEAETSTASYLRVLDSSPEPALEHLDEVRDSPVGVVQVLDLTPSQRDTLSLATLRQLSTNGDGDPFDLQEQPGSGVRVLRYSDLEVEGGYKGNRIAFSRTDDEGVTSVTEQIALVAPNADRIYQVVIHCSEECFETRKREIDVVLDSWNVRA